MNLNAAESTNALENDFSSKQEDFSTIDWMRDWKLDLIRSQKNEKSSISDIIQSPILLITIGIMIGTTAAIIDISVAYSSDFKRGVCVSDWYLSKDICCQGLVRMSEHCDNYVPWSLHLFGARFVLFDFLIFALSSIILAVGGSMLANEYSRYAVGSGLEEIKTILGGFIINGFFSVNTFFVKGLSLILVAASGLSIGKEAGMVHLSCCIGYLNAKLIPKYRFNEARKREILSACCAAGIAVAFGAPIGGVLFSMEEMSSFFPSRTMLRSFFVALVSVVTLQIFDPYRGKRVLYQVTFTNDWNFFEIIFFILLGAVGALLGIIFIRGNSLVLKLKQDRQWFKFKPELEILILSSITILLTYFSVYTRIDGTELLESLFRECDDSEHLGLCSNDSILIFNLSWALIVKLILPIITIGSLIPYGIFVPSMLWGALSGRILGEFVQFLYLNFSDWIIFNECQVGEECINPGMYALLGAISGLSGITNLTVSLTVIMFELTGTLSNIVPCMITVMTTKLVTEYLGSPGYISEMIKRKEYPFLDPKEEVLMDYIVGEKMTPLEQLTCFYGDGMSINRIVAILNSTDYQNYPIINSESDAGLLGVIARTDLLYALEKAKNRYDSVFEDMIVYFNDPINHLVVSPGLMESPKIKLSTYLENSQVHGDQLVKNIHLTSYVDRTPLSVDPEDTVEFLFDLFKKMGPRYVVIKKRGKLKGMITKKDLIQVIKRTKIESVGSEEDMLLE